MEEEPRLEAFIKKYREEFDDDRPSLKAWTNIERALDRRQKKSAQRKFLWLGMVASLLLLVGMTLGILLYPKLQEQYALQEIEETTELNEMEAFFHGEVQAHLAALKHTSLDSEISQSLSDIDEEINRLKLDLIYAPKSGHEQVLAAIIAAYESKIYILETALESVQLTPKIKENETTIL